MMEHATLDGRTPEDERPPTNWYGRLSRRMRVLLWLGLLVWLVGGVALLADWVSLGGGGGGDAAPGAAVPSQALMVVRSDEGPPALALAHAGPSGTSLLLLPAGTIVEVPGVGPRSLRAALDEHGQDAFAVALANVTGTQVPAVTEASPDAFRAFLAALGDITVEVPQTIEVEQDGVLRTLFREGAQRMDPGTLLRFMTIELPEQQDLERVARQNAAWRGILGALDASDARTQITGALAAFEGGIDAPAFASLLTDVAQASGTTVLTLPVTRVGVTGEDLYRIDDDGIARVAKALEDVRTRDLAASGRRVRLLVGARGAIGTPVASMLVASGFEIVSTQPATEEHDVTRAVIAENTEQLRATARELLDLMGTGRMGIFRHPQTVFDVTLVVGRDWAESNGFPQPD